jgi:hypothetical protein
MLASELAPSSGHFRNTIQVEALGYRRCCDSAICKAAKLPQTKRSEYSWIQKLRYYAALVAFRPRSSQVAVPSRAVAKRARIPNAATRGAQYPIPKPYFLLQFPSPYWKME